MKLRNPPAATADTDLGAATPPRSKWYLVYFLLAAFDLITVLASMWLGRQVMEIYVASVAVNQQWAERLGRYSELSHLAAAVNLPANNVFESHNVAEEATKLTVARAEFDKQLGVLRTELEHCQNCAKGSEAALLMGDLDAISREMAEVSSQASQVFSFYRHNQQEEAGAHMALMDRAYASVGTALAHLRAHVLTIQTQEFNQQIAVAKSLRRLESVVIALVVLMVVGVTIYGHLLARRMHAAACERERHLRALQLSEARNQSFIQSALDCILSTNRHGAIVEFNPAAERTFGCTREGALGRLLREFVLLPKARETGDSHAQQAGAAGDDRLVGKRIELTAVRADGSEFPAEVTITAVGEGAELLHTVYLHDISQRKQAETSLQLVNTQLKAGLSQVEVRTRELTLLTSMGQLLQTSLAPDEAYEVVARFALQLFPEWSGSLHILSASGVVVEGVASWGEAPPTERVFAPDDCWAMRHGRLHSTLDVLCSLKCRHWEDNVGEGSLCVPMTARSEIVGMLALRRNPGTTDLALSGLNWQATERLAVALAEHASLALSNLELRDKLRTQALRDPLTGLFNRRYLEETLERELRRAGRKRVSVGVIMLDIDQFKSYNDTFGHAGGDALLEQLGAFLKSQVRVEDIACRYGGEEFAIVLPEVGLEGTCERAERLRAASKALRAEYLHQPLSSVTLSLGVSVYPDHGESPESLLRAADAALYRAKAAGRDRVEIADASLVDTSLEKTEPLVFQAGRN